MVKKGYVSRQEAEVAAADWNAKRDSSKTWMRAEIGATPRIMFVGCG